MEYQRIHKRPEDLIGANLRNYEDFAATFSWDQARGLLDGLPGGGLNIARPEQSLEQCLALMTEERVRHLPVLEGEKLIGIVSIGDLVKSIIGDQKFIINQLEHYVHG